MYYNNKIKIYKKIITIIKKRVLKKINRTLASTRDDPIMKGGKITKARRI
jgi:hypothetical protein